MNNIRLIAMDMDGTLLNPAQQLSTGNRQALLEAQAAGIRLAICSGRMPADAAAFALENGLRDIAVLGLNGGLCRKTPLSSPYVNHVLPVQTARDCTAYFRSNNATVGLFAGDCVHVFPGRSPAKDSDWGSHWEHPHGPALIRGGDPDAIVRQGVNKIVCIEDDPQILAQYRAVMAGDPALQITSSWINNLELMPAGVDKGLAVRELAQELAVAPSQVMVLGDFDNDLSMFAYAGFAVAMGNAPECIRAAAHAVTRSNAEDGVAYAIRRWALPKPE